MSKKFENLKPGEVLSEQQYYRVLEKKANKVILKNDSGEIIQVDADYVENCLQSGEQFEKIQKVSRTEIIEKFINHSRTAMTVNFNKKLKEEEIKKQLYDLKFRNKTEYKKEIDRVIDLKGEERTMTGRHNGRVDEFGRVLFIDMQIEKENSKGYDVRQRLVDPRTINWCIIDNVKYIVK